MWRLLFDIKWNKEVLSACNQEVLIHVYTVERDFCKKKFKATMCNMSLRLYREYAL